MTHDNAAKTPNKVIHQRSQNANNRYFQLPDAVRLRVMKYVLASHSHHDKPIRMNNPVFLWEAWPVNRHRKPRIWSIDYFDSLESVLSSLDPYTSVCAAMRADVLAALFLVRRFHVVYSPFVGRESQPAATKYMDRYGALMASITLEVDFTKLGGGWKPEAATFDATAGLKGVKKLVEGFVQSQLTRSTSIQDLRVLVRRYYGVRPALDVSKPTHPRTRNKHTRKSTATNTNTTTTIPLISAAPPRKHPLLPLHPTNSPKQTNRQTLTPHSPAPVSTSTLTPTSTTPPPIPPPTPYTPTTQITQTLHPLKSLGPLVSRLTLTSVPESFAAELITSLWSADKKALRADAAVLAEHVTYRVPGREYPPFPSFPSLFGDGDGEGEGRGWGAVVGWGGDDDDDDGGGCREGVGGGEYEGVGEGELRVVRCGETREEWEGEYGCRLLVDGERVSGHGGKEVRVLGGLKLRREKGEKRRRRISKGVRGVLGLSVRPGRKRKVTDSGSRERTEEKGGEKLMQNGDAENAAVEMRMADLKVESGKVKATQGLFGRIVSGRKGLFGGY